MCLFSIITYYSNYVSKIKFLTGLLDQEIIYFIIYVYIRISICIYLCSNLMGVSKL